MAEIIDARVKQKTGVAADFAGFTLLEGEFALVRSSADGPVINYKVGPGVFEDLPWSLQVPGSIASVSPSTDFSGLPAGLYLPDADGTYDGTVPVDLTEGVTYLNWDGSTLTKQVYPINLSGYMPTSEYMLSRNVPQGKNLFNKNAVTSGKWLRGEDGVIENVLPDFSISEFIPVKLGDQFAFSGNFGASASNRISFFNHATDTVPHTYIQGQNVVTSPINGYMVTMTSAVGADIRDTLQIEYGTTPTSYEPFDGVAEEKLFEKYLPSWILDIELNGNVTENDFALVDGDTTFRAIKPINEVVDSVTTRVNFFDKSAVIQGQLLSSDGSLPAGKIIISSSAAWARTGPIKLDNGDYKILGITINENLMFAGLFDDPVTEAGPTQGDRITTNTFSVNDGPRYLTFTVKSSNFEADLDMIQVKRLNDSDDYVPYDKIIINPQALPPFTGSGDMQVMITSTAVLVRSGYDGANDLIQEYQYRNIPATNGAFSGVRVYKVPKSVPITANLSSYAVHSIGDSISPMGTPDYWFIIGQHGYYIARATAAGNTFSVNDELKDNLDRRFTVVYKSGYELYLAPAITVVGEDITRSWTNGSSTFTSLSTLDDSVTVAVSAVSGYQLKPMMSTDSQKIIIDGREVSDEGIYSANIVELVDVMTAIDPINAVFDGINAMSGNPLMTITQTYYFRSKSVYLTTNVDMKSWLPFIKYHGIQPLGLIPVSGYVPYVMYPKVAPQAAAGGKLAVDWNFPTDASDTTAVYSKYLFEVNAADLTDVNDVPDRTVQFLRNGSGDFRIGFAAGFDLESGLASKNSRPDYTHQAFEMIPSLSNKTYFRVLTDQKFPNGVLPASFFGQFNSYFCYYLPEENMQAYIVHTRDTSYVYIHTQEIFTKKPVMVEGIDGSKLVVVETSGVQLLTDRVINGTLYVSSTDSNANYLVLKTE